MTIKKIALGVCLLITGNTLAQDKTYTVKQGDTLSEIASKFGTNSKAILHANSLASVHKLKLGQKLFIPVSSAQASKSSEPISKNDGTSYFVQAGDNDGRIAKKLGVTAKELRLANLGTNWTKLQIGQSLNIPNAGNWFAARLNRANEEAKVAPATQVAATQPKATLVTSIKAPAARPKVVPKTYTVKSGDNDWIIAKRAGVKPSEIRALNPSVKWTNLKIGTVLRLPGTKVVNPAGQAENREPNLPAIRSRYAVVTGDSVTIRRGPSVRFDSVTVVDRGTRVLVLDREGSWYKARFPRGTEAWVRGDFLTATKAPQILASNFKSKKAVKKPTIVASKTTRSNSTAQRNERNVTARKPKDNGRPLVVASGGGSGLLEKASSYLGVRYRYGAASRSATDCSGFTTQVFRAQGVKLPRTAREQSGRGQKVSKGELKAGDLVFFNTRGSRVSHVGIYQGGGKFIHASSGKGKVMVSSLNEGYYQRRFAGARRVIASKPAAKKKVEVVAKKEEPKSTPVEKATEPVEPTKTVATGDNKDGK